MKYSIDIFVVCNNVGVRNAIMALIPGSNGAGVFTDGYENVVELTDDDTYGYPGDTVLKGRIRYDDTHKGARDALLTSLKGTTGLWVSCIAGRIKTHKCYNFDPTPIPCEIEEVFEK